MGLQLPGELTGLLAMLGYTWPEADEQKLFEMAQSWVTFGGGLPADLAAAHAYAQQVWTNNEGQAVQAFQAAWSDPESFSANLDDAGVASTIVGAALMACAGIVLALKINVIVQLIMLAIQIAQAIATAAVTFGASLLEIPIFKEITGLILDQLIDLALQAVLNG
ncbi:hypothetical protein Ais01nite_41590 [Asanoa ishikariensis]|uniref:Outer membrane channel protein CpnT-like N-terminal domain-containing protein n=1 Tax=Asanoa ishikariensis TaxID=137265 RepID=A0A1H3MIE2_9ACTN|nr:hypothetical protein [Asanoa ishikariensis]GIF66124.1 hypothetical protein Ais01nite_41590 [Asanoa ishikariensis]SDY75855.1 hypothetical protein SAMN05421684_1398 [Asanoa ishikariensis]